MRLELPTPTRFAVEYRAPGSRTWTTIVTVGTAELATRTLMDLLDTRVGDWCVRPVTDEVTRPGLFDGATL